MPHTIVVRLLLVSILMLPCAVVAGDPPPSVAGVVHAADVAIPARPLATRAQLDAYLHDTPPQQSPLNWLTPAGRQRFLASLIFGENGIGGFSSEELRYDLTRRQAYQLLQLFGSESYAINMDARTRPRVASAADAASALEPGYAALVTAADAGDIPSVMHAYQTTFAPQQTDAQRRALDDTDMGLLFRATARLIDASSPAAHLADLRADFAELERRHLVDRPQAGDYYDALVRARQIDEAHALLVSHPALDRNPPLAMRTASRIRKGQPSLWVPNLNKRELVRFRFNVHVPSQILVLGSPGCLVCINAARSLEADPLLRDIFRDYAQWVASSADITDWEAVREWNRTYTNMRLGINYDDRELPMIKQFDMPTFFFLDHGTVVDTVVGWPDAGHLEAIRHGLREIDLMR